MGVIPIDSIKLIKIEIIPIGAGTIFHTNRKIKSTTECFYFYFLTNTFLSDYLIFPDNLNRYPKKIKSKQSDGGKPWVLILFFLLF